MALRVPLDARGADNGDERGGQATQVAFEDLWQHRAALRDICQRIVGDAATADDVVQETYMRALRNLDTLERRPSLMPWLATVARRRSIDELRRRGYQHPVDEMPDEGTKPEYDPGETAAVNETVSQVRQALTSLTDRERELLMRQVNQGLSLAELAESEDSSVASVRSVLSRARTKLRDALSDAGARVLGPIGALGAWLKRKTADVNVKVQQASPLVSGGYDRLGEVATASVTAAALAVGGALVPAGASTSGDEVAAAETVEVSGHQVSAVSSGIPLADERDDGRSRTDATSSNDEGAETAEASSLEGPKASFRSGDDRPFDTARVSEPESPESPDARTEHGNPVAKPDEPANEPEEADIFQITAPLGSQAADGAPIFALGTYFGCTQGSCNALFRSGDGGATWTALPATGLNAHTLLVPPAFGDGENRLFAMGENGLQVSTDAGESFSVVPNSPLSGPAAMSPAFNSGEPDDDRIFIGEAPFWKYDVGDRSTTPLGYTGLTATQIDFAFSPDFSEDGLVVAGGEVVTPQGSGYGVYDCVDGACTGQILPGLTGAPSVHVADVGSADGLVTLAWLRGTLYRSVGEGAFEYIDGLPFDGKIVEIADDGDGRLYAAFKSTDPNSPNGGVAVSDDGGLTWTAVGGEALTGGAISISATPRAIVVGVSEMDGRGVMCSEDGGATWARRCG